jgi:hypothetical protein
MNAENDAAVGPAESPAANRPQAEKLSPGILNAPAHIVVAQRLPRFLFVHNPFYLISAACVFYGLYARFNSSSVASNG